jgi:hypothetical protein
MEKNLNSGKTASENRQQFQESKRELLLIGDQVARLFLSAPPSPLLPEWNLSERDNIFETDKVEESEESSESENDDNQDNSGTTERTVPAESTRDEARDESDPIDQQLVKLRLRIEEMRLHLQQI